MASQAALDLNCNFHQIEFINCLSEPKNNYKLCYEHLDKFRFCLLEKNKTMKETEKTEINPKVF